MSGYETSCAMIGAEDWPFTKVRTAADEMGIRVVAVYGLAPNEGSTDAALHRIMANFKEVRSCSNTMISFSPGSVGITN